MRAALFSLLILFFSFTNISAQLPLTIEAGKTISGMSGFNDATTESWDEWFANNGYAERVQEINNDMVLAYVLGITTSLPVVGNLTFNPGLHIAKHGGKAFGAYGIDGGNEAMDFSNSYRITQVQIPLSLRYWFGSFFLDLDPQLGFILMATSKETEEGHEDDINNKAATDMNRVTFGIGGGGGFLIGKSGLGLFGRLIGNINKVDKTDHFDTPFRSVMWNGGLFYNIGGKQNDNDR